MADSKPSATGKKPASKADFVRSLPFGIPPAEVVEKAKAAGLKISIAHVRTIRWKADAAAKKPVAAKAKPAPVAKKPVAATAKPVAAPKKPVARPAPHVGKVVAGGKAGFVRSLPATTPAKDVVAAAAKRGLKMTLHYVYNVRAKTKARGAKVRRPVVVAAKVAAPIAKKPTVRSTKPETEFGKLALDLGLSKAKTLLTALEQKVAGVMSKL